MAESDNTAADVAARYIEAIGRGHKEVEAAIEALANNQDALDLVQAVFEATEAAHKASVRLRAGIVGKVWEADEMTAAAMADRINVTRQRVGQIAKAQRTGKES